MDAISVIVHAISTVVVAVIGFFSARSAKRSAREKKLQEELAAKKKQEEDEKFERLRKAVDDLAKAVERLEESVNSHNREINRLSKLSKVEIDYTKSISNVINALAEGLRDNNIDGNVTRALESYSKFESSQLETMYKLFSEEKQDK